MEYDISTKLNQALAFNTQAIASSTTTVGNILDTQGYEALDLSLVTGTITDGDYALTIEHGDDSGLSDAATVPAASIIGTLPAFTEDTDDDSVLHCGYIGKKRYVRVSVVSTNVTSGGTVSVLATFGHPYSAPTITV